MQDAKAKLLEMVEEVEGLYEIIVSGKLLEVVKVVGQLSEEEISEVADMLEAEMDEDDEDLEDVDVEEVSRNNPGPGVGT